MIETIQWTDDGVVMIDQTRLPNEEIYVTCRSYAEVAEAIRSMVIRGAPAIGVAAAMGVAIGIARADREGLDSQMATISAELAATRPTAVNLFWAIDRMNRLYRECRHLAWEEIRDRLIAEARLVRTEDIEINNAIGRHGAPLVPDGKTVLTHCNAGALATAGYGTALGVIRAAVQAGKDIDVFADETRPFLQGARLTAWEMMHDGIPTTVLCDNMAASLMRQGKIQAVIVGSDRVAANGDVANKIGTYGVAILAKEHGIPFYVACPWSTIDLATPNGDAIPIEQRPAIEVTHHGGKQLTPYGVGIENPAFDVTPARYVTAIITERGVLRQPYGEALRGVEAATAVSARY